MSTVTNQPGEDRGVARVANAIWREDHYDPQLCSHAGDGGTSCAYCEPHDDDTPDDWPADKERAERQAKAAIAAMSQHQQERIAALEAVLRDARSAIASLDEDALGMGSCVVDFHDGREEPYPIRDELLENIDALLEGEGDE